LRLDLPGRVVDRVPVRDVDLEAESPVAGRLDVVDRTSESGRTAGEHRDVEPARRQLAHDGTPDTSRPAGDDRDPARSSHPRALPGRPGPETSVRPSARP